VINIGLDVFAQELEAGGVAVIQVDWRPPAGDPNVAALVTAGGGVRDLLPAGGRSGKYVRREGEMDLLPRAEVGR
jgi:hypothetical protein